MKDKEVPGLMQRAAWGFIGSAVAVLSGCAWTLRKYDPWYTRVAPRYYDPTEAPLMFRYALDDAQWMIDEGLVHGELIGTMQFNANARNPRDFYRYGQSVGADVIVLGVEKTGEQTVTGTQTVYDRSTATVYDDDGSAVGSVVTSTPREVPYTYTVGRYDYSVWFYKDDPATMDLWEMTLDTVEFEKSKKKGLQGAWSDGDYTLEIGASGTHFLGFVTNVSPKKASEIEKGARELTGRPLRWWDYGDLKVVIDRGDLTGIWLMGDKTPVPCKFSLEKKTRYLKGECANGHAMTFAPVER